MEMNSYSLLFSIKLHGNIYVDKLIVDARLRLFLIFQRLYPYYHSFPYYKFVD